MSTIDKRRILPELYIGIRASDCALHEHAIMV